MYAQDGVVVLSIPSFSTKEAVKYAVSLIRMKIFWENTHLEVNKK